MPEWLTFLSKDALLSRERVSTEGPELDVLDATRHQGSTGMGVELDIKNLEEQSRVTLRFK